jgi:lipoate-protein ligase A
VLDSKSCSATENLGQVVQLHTREIPKFALRENDYVFGDLKVGGNAQSIIKDGWLHHTSFLWDYDPENMDYLTLPQKRPEYRGNRSHDDFLVKLRPYFVNKNVFFTSLLHTCEKRFHVEKTALVDAITIIDEKLGGMDAWWEANRTRLVYDL